MILNYLGREIADMEFEEFYYMLAQADLVREMRIQDLKKAMVETIGTEE